MFCCIIPLKAAVDSALGGVPIGADRNIIFCDSLYVKGLVSTTGESVESGCIKIFVVPLAKVIMEKREESISKLIRKIVFKINRPFLWISAHYQSQHPINY